MQDLDEGGVLFQEFFCGMFLVVKAACTHARNLPASSNTAKNERKTKSVEVDQLKNSLESETLIWQELRELIPAGLVPEDWLYL